jgi:hypothetical protein
MTLRTLILTLLLLAVCTLGAQAVTISSPLAPPRASANLTLTAPVIPPPGIILGWAGGSGAGLTGSVAFNFGPAKWQPLSFDLISMDNFKTEVLGVFFPASKVLSAVGLTLPPGSIWAILAGAVGGGPYVGYDTDSKKAVWGGYYRASVLQVSF